MSRQHSSISSRVLHVVDDWTAKAWVAGILSMVTLATLISLLVAGVTNNVVTVFAAVVQAVTLAMVFVVQHTQERYQNITQRKLDELLLATHGAGRDVVHAESASDDVLDELSRRHETASRRSRR